MELSGVAGGGPKKLKPKRHCRVLFNYLPNHDDELFLQVDDIIEIIAEVEEGWWQGRLNGKIGVFPSNFVTEIDCFANVAAAATPSAAVVPTPNSDDKHANEATGAASVAASVAATTTLTAAMAVADGAAAVAANAAAGGATDDNPTKCTIPKTAGKTICIAKYLYSAKNADELTLREGDLITLLSTETQDKGWWLGEVNGKKGVFPDNFVMLANFDQNSQTFHNRKELAKNAAAAAAAAAAVAAGIASSATTAAVASSATATAKYQSSNVAAQRESLQASASSVDIRNGGGVSHVDSSGSCRKAFNSDLDDVERTILLTDLRASRAKPPKRRPPTSGGPEDGPLADPCVLLDHNQNSFLSPSEKSNQNENIYDAISETNVAHVSLTEASVTSNISPNRNGSTASNASSAGGQVAAESGAAAPSAPSAPPVAGSLTRNKIKEWEKHKVPWIDELKLNQKTKKVLPAAPSVVAAGAPAASVSVAGSHSALPPEISCSINITVPSYAAPPAPFANTHHSGDAVTDSPQKSFAHLRETAVSPPSALASTATATAGATPPPKATSKPIRLFAPFSNSNSSSSSSSSSSSILSTSDKDNNNENCEDNLPAMFVERSKFESLQNRVSTLEALMASSFHEFGIVIEELKAKLEIEKDLRNLLQVQLEKLLHANKMRQM